MEDACQYIILQENFHDKYPHWNFYVKICFEKSRIDFSMVQHILTFRDRLETAKDSTACEIHNVLLPWTFWVWIGTSWNLQFCFMLWKREERECTSPQKKKNHGTALPPSSSDLKIVKRHGCGRWKFMHQTSDLHISKGNFPFLAENLLDKHAIKDIHQ